MTRQELYQDMTKTFMDVITLEDTSKKPKFITAQEARELAHPDIDTLYEEEMCRLHAMISKSARNYCFYLATSVEERCFDYVVEALKNYGYTISNIHQSMTPNMKCFSISWKEED